MKGVVKTRRGPGHVALVDVPEPEPSAGRVRIAAKSTSVSDENPMGDVSMANY